MIVLQEWEAKRAGGRITVTHESGKIANIDTIRLENGLVIATHSDGRKFRLATFGDAK